MRLLAALSLAPALVLPATLSAQTVLQPGTMLDGNVSGGAAGEYRLQLPGAGFLTVITRSHDGADLRLIIRDDEGQVMPDGQVDGDFGGDLGAEQVVLTIPGPGEYLVGVETYSMGGASFTVGASFLPSDLAASAPDPDGKPSGARGLAVGESHDDSIDPAGGDAYDWYRLEVDQTGVLTVLTRSEGDGDLRLDLFADGAFGEPLETSDQDENGVLGNESVSLDVSPGETWWVRVGPSQLGYGSAASYRIASGVIPG